MLKKLLRALKVLIMAALILYGYNIIAAPLNLIVPINFVTIGLVALFGVPAVFGLVVILLIGY